MARDFDNAGEVVEIPHYAEMGTLTQWSWSIWSLRRSDGSGTLLGRIADKPHRWFCLRSQFAANLYELDASWSTTQGIWRWQSVDAAEWVHRIATYDGSSPANDPTVYENGAPVSLTRVQTPAGTYGNESLPTAIGIGNVPTFRDRTWDGLHAEFGLWNRVLTPGEAALVYLRGPLAVPDGLVCYVPLYGTQSPEPNFLSPENPGTVIGATGAAHPTIVLPWGVDLTTPVVTEAPPPPTPVGVEAAIEVGADLAAALRATRRVQASIESEPDADVEAAIARLLASVAEVEPDAAALVRPARQVSAGVEMEGDAAAAVQPGPPGPPGPATLRVLAITVARSAMAAQITGPALHTVLTGAAARSFALAGPARRSVGIPDGPETSRQISGPVVNPRPADGPAIA